MYRPLYSVQDFGKVPSELLNELIDFYCKTAEPKILDTTVNHGRIWGKSKREYTGLDIDPSVDPDVVADNTAMPFLESSWDILIYDPPHTTEQGKSTIGFAEKYGTGVTGANLFHTYPPFLREARRVLRPKGLLLVKLADCTHHAKFQFATAEFWGAANEVGFELQGLHILPRKNVIIDPKWKNATHPRQNHCTWMAFKKK